MFRAWLWSLIPRFRLAVPATTVYLHRTVMHRALRLHPFAEWMFKFVNWITTGGLGLLGGHCAARLDRRGHQGAAPNTGATVEPPSPQSEAPGRSHRMSASVVRKVAVWNWPLGLGRRPLGTPSDATGRGPAGERVALLAGWDNQMIARQFSRARTRLRAQTLVRNAFLITPGASEGARLI